MIVVFCYRGKDEKSKVRADALRRYNALVKSTIDVCLFYRNGVPYLTGNRQISITNTMTPEGEKIELIAIGTEPLGIDIEYAQRHVNMDIARRYFTSVEREYIGSSESRLLEIWQMREALGKSLKIGMYKDNVLGQSGFRWYDIYEGYNVVVYSKERDISFIAM